MGETYHKPGGQGHYVESFKLESLLDPEQDILLAIKMDNKPLSMERGAPMRVIAPYRLAYKSIKFVRRIEFTKKKQYGWWTLANPVYSWEAFVSKQRLRKK
jgi:DMSO/TMAO reductase YedYZ molybdopterin-dependent catalytic subunit